MNEKVYTDLRKSAMEEQQAVTTSAATDIPAVLTRMDQLGSELRSDLHWSIILQVTIPLYLVLAVVIVALAVNAF